ncbi:MAG: M20 family metallopeptidase [Acetobacteraceae bacterium]
MPDDSGPASSADAASLLASLVAIPSINPAFRTADAPAAWFGEAAIAAHVAAWLRGHGALVELDEALPDRPNVIARLQGRGARRRLVWEGHLDTVQVSGMTVDPFRPALRDGRLYGRGAVDDKGCLAAFMLAFSELARDPAPLDLTFVAAVDEEFQFRGILHHLKRGEPAEGGVAGEPTSLRVVSACKGCVRWEIEVRGRAAHSSQPERGIDAIAIATELAVYLRRLFGPRLAARAHPLLGRASLICSMIEGGEGLNTVPASCRMKFDRRTLPDETGCDAWREVAAEVDRFAVGLDQAAAVITHPPFIDSISMEVALDSAIVAAARASCRAEGLPDAALGVPFGSDASKMTRAGIPTIIFGPGDIDQAHTADEFVEVAEVVRAGRMLADMARRFGSG